MVFDESSTDEVLMEAYQKGAENAFDILFRRHSSRVYGFLANRLKDRSQADDVFQAAFLKLHQSRSHYDPAFPFLPWLFTICKSVLIDHVRKKQRIREDNNEYAIAASVDQQTEDINAPEIELDVLSIQQRAVIDLRYKKDLSFEKIALRLQTSPSNVRQIISRGIKKLRHISAKKETK